MNYPLHARSCPTEIQCLLFGWTGSIFGLNDETRPVSGYYGVPKLRARLQTRKGLAPSVTDNGAAMA